jgi:hypothetical protein
MVCDANSLVKEYQVLIKFQLIATAVNYPLNGQNHSLAT